MDRFSFLEFVDEKIFILYLLYFIRSYPSKSLLRPLKTEGFSEGASLFARFLNTTGRG